MSKWKVEVVEANADMKQRWHVRVLHSNGKVHLTSEKLLHRAYAMKVGKIEAELRGCEVRVVPYAERLARAGRVATRKL